MAPHVLRHWEDAGVVVPGRTPAGHRDYSDEHVRRMRILQACQRVGLSLTSIRLILHRNEAGRDHVIDEHLRRIRRQKLELDDAEAFLVHVLACEHDLMTRCGRCSAYATRDTAQDLPTSA